MTYEEVPGIWLALPVGLQRDKIDHEIDNCFGGLIDVDIVRFVCNRWSSIGCLMMDAP